MKTSIDPKLLDFLTDLKNHNTKEWFDENRKSYENLKKEFVLFLDQIIKKLSHINPDFADLEGKKCLFRINRDIRFSKDKSPYKTNFGAHFTTSNEKGKGGAGYYLHIEPKNTFIGGGIWMPEAATLNNIRQEIDYNFKEFEKIINAPKFKSEFNQVDGEKLKNPPKGYDKENPAIEFLKNKSFVVSKKLADKEITAAAFTANILQIFEAMTPFISFLNKANTIS